MDWRGYRTLGALAVCANVGLLMSIAIPMIGTMRMSAAFDAGERAVQRLLEEARSSAIDSGRGDTIVDIEGDRLLVRAGAELAAQVVASIDSSRFMATFTGTNLPIHLDGAGRRTNPETPTVTIVNSRIPATRTFSVDPLGQVATTAVASEPPPGDTARF